MWVAAGEGACAGPGPSGDVNVAPRTGLDLHIDIGCNFGIWPSTAGIHGQTAIGGLAGYGHVGGCAEIVFGTENGGVGTQGHTQRQD